MKYITLSDLSNTIRKNLWKIPRNIDFIMGIPRSGTICGSIISEFLNVPFIDIDSFIAGVKPYGGGRLRHFYKRQKETGRVLVVDDTVFNGSSKVKAKEKLAMVDGYQFIFMAVYREGPARDAVDFFLEDISSYTNNFTELVYYEWNIFHHNEGDMAGFLFDLDGVFCPDPPDERNEQVYLDYIRSAPPLFTPSVKIGGIVTFRLIKNQEITQEWLARNGIDYGFLCMFNAQSWDERNNAGIDSGTWKGEIFKSLPQYRLFVESSAQQAGRIHEISEKPVLCTENNRLYGGA